MNSSIGQWGNSLAVRLPKHIVQALNLKVNDRLTITESFFSGQMKEQYSTQQLNQNLPEVLKQIEQGNSIEITQEGKPFAYILSASEYQRLTARTSTFWTSLQEFYDHNDLEELEIEADVFADVRDRSPGREVNF